MAEETKTKERVGIKLDLFPNWSGKRTSRSLGIEGTAEIDGKKTKIKQNYRFDCEIPVPSTDEEAVEIFGEGMTIDTLVAMGVEKISYDRDTNIGNLITQDLVNGVDFGNLEDVDKYATEFQSELSTPKAKRVGVAKETKRKASVLDGLYAKYGVTNEAELMALLDKVKGAKK